jgi:nitroimidazol reductase NimA-like FMN-containing flavoprotein (pyridoxamine 5'-phosphate oxidase superfamily)
MENESTQNPNVQIRRQDRAVKDEAWIKDFLIKAPYCVMATALEDQPYIHTNLFVYEPSRNCIFLHTAHQGRTPDAVRANGKVCITVSEMGRLLPASTAREFSVEYTSVIVFGRADILDNMEERTYGLQALMDKYFPRLRPGEHYPVIDEAEMRGVAVYRIDIDAWSAKRKRVEPNFPGAFYFNELSK